MTERLRSASTAGTQCPKMENDLSPRKTLMVLVIVVGCFAVLWPKVFYPMLVGSANQHLKPSPIDKATGCCDVISETDVNTIKIMSELCGTIIKSTEEKPLTGKEIVQRCRQEVLDTCGIDISVVLQEQVRLGQSVKQILDEIRSLNGSLCLKYNYGVAPWRLGVPHRITVKTASDISNIRQERPMHLRSELVHPAFRERGSAIPHPQPVAPTRPPPRVVEGRPGPVPGMRPTIGGAGHVVPPSKQGTSSMSVIMPIYTIGIVIFFTYTLMKIIFKKQPDGVGDSLYPPIDPDPHFRKEVFESESNRLASRLTRENISSKLGDVELDQLRHRLRETELAMERIVEQMSKVPLKAQDLVNGTLSNGDAVKPHDEEQPTVKVLGMEMTASCEGGKKWSRPDSPVIPTSSPPPAELAPPPQEIYLEGALPAQSHLLVAESATEPEPMSGEDPAVVLSGKMTLSVISLDSENGGDTANGTEDGIVEKQSIIQETFTKSVPIGENLQKVQDDVKELEKTVQTSVTTSTESPNVESDQSPIILEVQDDIEKSLTKIEEPVATTVTESTIKFLEELIKDEETPITVEETGLGVEDKVEQPKVEQEIPIFAKETGLEVEAKVEQKEIEQETLNTVKETGLEVEDKVEQPKAEQETPIVVKETGLEVENKLGQETLITVKQTDFEVEDKVEQPKVEQETPIVVKETGLEVEEKVEQKEVEQETPIVVKETGLEVEEKVEQKEVEQETPIVVKETGLEVEDTVEQKVEQEIPITVKGTSLEVEDILEQPTTKVEESIQQPDTINTQELIAEALDHLRAVDESLSKQEEITQSSGLEKDIEDFLQKLREQSDFQAPSITLESEDVPHTLEVEALEREVDDLIQEAIESIEQREILGEILPTRDQETNEISNEIIQTIPETSQSQVILQDLNDTRIEEIESEIAKIIEEVQDLPSVEPKLEVKGALHDNELDLKTHEVGEKIPAHEEIKIAEDIQSIIEPSQEIINVDSVLLKPVEVPPKSEEILRNIGKIISNTKQDEVISEKESSLIESTKELLSSEIQNEASTKPPTESILKAEESLTLSSEPSNQHSVEAVAAKDVEEKVEKVNVENVAADKPIEVTEERPKSPKDLTQVSRVEEDMAKSAEIEDDELGSDEELVEEIEEIVYEEESGDEEEEEIEIEVEESDEEIPIDRNTNRTESSSLQRVNGERSEDLVTESKYTTVSGATAAENEISDEELTDNEEVEEDEEIIEIEELEDEDYLNEEGNDVNHIAGESEPEL